MDNQDDLADRASSPDSPGVHPDVSVLYEDNHLLAINKPARLATMGAAAGQTTLLSLAKEYIKRKYAKPGNVYLGIVSRLDAPVTGVVLLARTSKAADRLTRQFRDNRVTKTYWALISGKMDPPEGTCVDWLWKNERLHRVQAVAPSHAGARQARLSYRTLRQLAEHTLLEIRLETGRKHQIRVQLARRGSAVLGDRKYGSKQAFARGIALHARQLALEHPVRGLPLRLVAPLPESWRGFGM